MPMHQHECYFIGINKTYLTSDNKSHPHTAMLQFLLFVLTFAEIKMKEQMNITYYKPAILHVNKPSSFMDLSPPESVY